MRSHVLSRLGEEGADLDIAELGSQMCVLVDDLLAAQGIDADRIRQTRFREQLTSLWEEHTQIESERELVTQEVAQAPTPELRLAALAQAQELRLESQGLQKSLRHIVADMEEDSQEILRASARATRTVLSYFRPLGGRVENIAPHSAPAGRRTLEAALQNFPTEWIEHSNAADPMTVRLSASRGYYRPNFHTITRRTPQVETVTMPAQWQPTAEQVEAEEWQHVNILSTGENQWRKITQEEFDPARGECDVNGVPLGNRWRRRTRDDGSQYWSRPVLVEQQSIQQGAELNIRSGPTAQAVAAHEFAHRIEHLNDNILQAQRAHHVRRTTMPDGTRQAPEVFAYNPSGGKEYVQPSNYANKYMGRIYPESQRFTEILSSGVEALFYGEHGGFMGVGGKFAPDPFSRSFTLGVLAAV